MNIREILNTPTFEAKVKEGYFLILRQCGDLRLVKIKSRRYDYFWSAHVLCQGRIFGLNTEGNFYVCTVDKCLDVSDVISKERKEELDSGISKNLVGVDILGNKIDKNDIVLFGRDYSYYALNATSVHKKIVKFDSTHIKLNNCLNLTNCFPELIV